MKKKIMIKKKAASKKKPNKQTQTSKGKKMTKHEHEHEHEIEEEPRELTEEEPRELTEEESRELTEGGLEEEQEKTLDLRALGPWWRKKDGKLQVVVINDGPVTGRDVVVSVEYAGGTYTGKDKETGKERDGTGKQNRTIKRGAKKGKKFLVTFTLPNDDCWNPDLLFDITVDTGGDSEKNETVIVEKKYK